MFQLPFSRRLEIADTVIGICFLFGEGVALHLEQIFGNQSFPAHILQGFAAGAIATASWQTRQRLRRLLIPTNTDDDHAIDMDAMERGEDHTIHIHEHAELEALYMGVPAVPP